MNKPLITRFRYENLRNETHVEYNQTYTGVIVRHDPEALRIKPQFDKYRGLLTVEVNSLDIIRKSEYTTEIAAQNNLRNSIFRGLSDAVKSGLNHFDDDKRIASKRLSVALARYGNIAMKTLDEATAAIDDLIRELNAGHAEDVALLTLGDWLVQLNLANTRFKELMEERYAEAAQRPKAKMKESRTNVDKALREMLDQVEALVLVDGIEAYETLITELNVVSDRYKNQLAQSLGRRKVSIEK